MSTTRRLSRRGLLKHGAAAASGAALLADVLGAARGVVGRNDLDVGQAAQEVLALRERLRVRADAADLRQLGPRQGDQLVHHLELGLRDDRQIVLEQQVVVAMDAAAGRVLDRQQPV